MNDRAVGMAAWTGVAGQSTGATASTTNEHNDRRATPRMRPSLTGESSAGQGGSMRLAVAVDRLRRERGQADGDVLGTARVGCRVADALARRHAHQLAGADVEHARGAIRGPVIHAQQPGDTERVHT